MGNLLESISFEAFVRNIIFISTIALIVIAFFVYIYIIRQRVKYYRELFLSAISYSIVLVGAVMLVDNLHGNVFSWHFAIPWMIIYFISITYPFCFIFMKKIVRMTKLKLAKRKHQHEIQTKLSAFLASKDNSDDYLQKTKSEWFAAKYHGTSPRFKLPGISDYPRYSFKHLFSIPDSLEKIHISINHIKAGAKSRNIKIDSDISALQSLLNEKEKFLVNTASYIYDTKPSDGSPIARDFENHTTNVSSHLKDIQLQVDAWFLGLNSINDGDDVQLAKKVTELKHIVQDTKIKLNPEDYIYGVSLSELEKKYKG